MPSTSIKTSQIKDDAVTFDKVENATSENVLVGRGSGNGGGNYQPITVGTGLTMSGTTLNASGGVSDGDKGDITVSSSGSLWTIDLYAVTGNKIANNTITGGNIQDNAITFNKLSTINASKLLGKGTGTSGTLQEITLGSGLTMTGSTLSASGGGVSYTAFKTTDETTFTTNGSYAWDSNLQISAGVEGWYSLEVYVISSCTAICYLGIDNVQGYAKTSPTQAAGYDLYNNGPNVGYANTGNYNFTKISGIVYLYGQNMRFSYYKQGGGNVTIHTGSYMKVEKIS